MGSKEKNPLFPGMKFGRLTVVERLNRPNSIYKCKCECGNEKNVAKNNLLSGRTISCGCLHKEIVKNMMKKQNDFIFAEGYVIGKTCNTGKEFFISTEDYEKVKDFCWYEMNNGYISTKSRALSSTLHRYLMNPPVGLVVDHINHNKADNRRENLRVCSYSANGKNRVVQPKGIEIKHSGKQTYYAVYMCGKYRGCFKSYEEAKKLRDRIYADEYTIY